MKTTSYWTPNNKADRITYTILFTGVIILALIF